MTVFFLSFSSSLLFSEQPQAPLDPGIELPPVLLEIEDQIIENVETALPDVDLPEASTLSLQLPDAESPMADLDDLSPSGEELVKDKPEDTRGHYFDIIVGVGSLASIFADVTWHYSSGDGVDFSLNLAHENHLFWNYKPLEQQGMSREEAFAFDLSVEKGKNFEQFNFEYDERQFWLQNKVVGVDSVTYRNIALTNAYNRELSDILTLKTRAELVSAMASDNYAENLLSDTLFRPGIGLALEKELYRFELDFDYQFGASGSDLDHFIRVYSSFDINLPYHLQMGGGFGLNWSSDEKASAYSGDYFGLAFPFAVRFSGEPLDYLEFKIEGGFREKWEDYQALHEQLEWIEMSNVSVQQGWFFDAGIYFPIKKIAKISSELEYWKSSSLISLGAMASGLVELIQGAGETLFLSAGVEVTPIDEVSLSLGWRGELLSDKLLVNPEHRIDFLMEYVIPQKWFGGSVELQFDIYEEAWIPEFNLDFFFEIKKGYKIRIIGEDLLSPLYAEGRPSRSLFIEKGINVAIMAEISL